jgi:hypothetical protein
MDKKKVRKTKPDINEIAFRVVNESTNEVNLCKPQTSKKPKSSSK